MVRQRRTKLRLASRRWPRCSALHPLRVGTKHGRWRFQQRRAGDCFEFDARQGGTEDATQSQYCRASSSHRNDAARNLSARRNCNCRRYENRSLADPQEGRGYNPEEWHCDCRGDGTRRLFGELSALLNQPHTADVRTLEASEFRVAHADLLVEDPVVLLYVAAILAQRLNLANEALTDMKSEASRQRVASV